MNIDPNVRNCATPTKCNCLESGEADPQVFRGGSGEVWESYVQQSALDLPLKIEWKARREKVDSNLGDGSL